MCLRARLVKGTGTYFTNARSKTRKCRINNFITDNETVTLEGDVDVKPSRSNLIVTSHYILGFT